MTERSGSIRVLIVEDEAIIAADLKLMVRRLGYVPAGVVTTGEEAIRAARELQPDAIVMDVRLDGAMNGMEAACRIREEQNPAIIYVTAFNRIAAADLGAGDRCLGKPFTRGDLRKAIEDALGELRAAGHGER